MKELMLINSLKQKKICGTNIMVSSLQKLASKNLVGGFDFTNKIEATNKIDFKPPTRLILIELAVCLEAYLQGKQQVHPL